MTHGTNLCVTSYKRHTQCHHVSPLCSINPLTALIPWHRDYLSFHGLPKWLHCCFPRCVLSDLLSHGCPSTEDTSTLNLDVFWYVSSDAESGYGSLSVLSHFPPSSVLLGWDCGSIHFVTLFHSVSDLKCMEDYCLVFRMSDDGHWAWPALSLLLFVWGCQSSAGGGRNPWSGSWVLVDISVCFIVSRGKYS